MLHIILLLFLSLNSPLQAKDGVVLFDENGHIIQLNEEVLRYKIPEGNDFDLHSLENCQTPFSSLKASHYLQFLKGRSVIDLFPHQKIKELIESALNGEENKIKIIGQGKKILVIEANIYTRYHQGFQTKSNRHTVRTLTFRYLDPLPKQNIPKTFEKMNHKRILTLLEKSNDSLKYYHLILYLQRKMFFLNGEKVDLTPEEFAILLKLVENPDQPNHPFNIFHDIFSEYAYQTDHSHLDSLLNKLNKIKKHIQQKTNGEIYLKPIITNGKYEGEIIVFRDLIIDPTESSGKAFLMGEEIDINPKQFKILHFMAKRPDTLFTKKELIEGINQEYHSSYKELTSSEIAVTKSKLQQYKWLIQTIYSGSNYLRILSFKQD